MVIGSPSLLRVFYLGGLLSLGRSVVVAMLGPAVVPRRAIPAPSLRLAIPRVLTDRQRHELPGRQVAEPALIRNRAMAQQLCQHAQRLVGEILVDEGFLPG